MVMKKKSGKPHRLQTNVSTVFLNKLDVWRNNQEKIPTREEALQILASLGLFHNNIKRVEEHFAAEVDKPKLVDWTAPQSYFHVVREVYGDPPKKEAVNHPDHYGGKDNPYEVIKVIEAWELDFHLGQVVRYIGRPTKADDFKDAGSYLQDLKKARWYLDRKIEQMEQKK